MKSIQSVLGASALIFALTAGFGTALADNHECKGKWDTQKRVDKMKTDLTLSDEQSDSVKKVLDDTKLEMDKIRMQMDELKVKMDDEILKVLDDDQSAKYKDMKQKREAKRDAECMKTMDDE